MATSLSGHRQALFKELTTTNLQSSPETALFYAERWHALDPSDEPATFYLSTALARTNKHIQALWQLRQPVTYIPSPSSSDPALAAGDNNPFARKRNTSSHHGNGGQSNSNSIAGGPAHRITRPAVVGSLRCARLYAQCCLVLNRQKEGRDALSSAMNHATTHSHQMAPTDATTSSSDPSSEPHAIELELARLAKAAGEQERAILSYRKVLDIYPWCWEALEALANQGAPPDPKVLFPARPRPPRLAGNALPPSSTSTTSSSATTMAPTLSSTTRHTNMMQPAPLGPSQTSAVNSTFSFGSNGTATHTRHKGRNMAPAGEIAAGFFTPGEMTGPIAIGPGGGKAKVQPALFAPGVAVAGWRKQAVYRPSDTSDMLSLDESSSSFESSFYPPQQLNFGAHTSTSTQTAPSSRAPSSLGSLFTPPTTTAVSNAPVPGVKRTRGGQASTAYVQATPSDDGVETRSVPPAAINGRRVVRGVPAGSEAAAKSRQQPRSDASTAAPTAGPTRRSSRLSREASNGGSSASMVLSRSQQTNASSTASVNGTQATTRTSKKRSKAGAQGPAVLSDTGSDALSSSPVPASPPQNAAMSGNSLAGVATAAAATTVDPAVLDAEEYVSRVVRGFAQATCAAASFEGIECIDAILALPAEQQKTWRALVTLGKAHMEMLNYDKAQAAFAQARTVAPHLTESMELYSTLLWHLRSATGLSFLSQELMLIAPQSSVAWIASGNVFSHLEDHGAALRCFKRAAQLDPDSVYAYTLSGHECVVLEEWERALGFFREAVRRDKRHYNAWFGLGNVYMHKGKYRMAEYHFRKASEINPTNATLLCCIGLVFERLGRLRDAFDKYTRAVALAPSSPAVRFKRVRMLLVFKQYELAESDLLWLKDRAPDEFNVHLYLGRLYKLVGRKTDMLHHFALAQDLEPRSASMLREMIEKDKSVLPTVATATGRTTESRGMDLDLDLDQA